VDITVIDFREGSWHEARRVELQDKVLATIKLLVEHMGGGVPVEFPVTIDGRVYVMRLDRVKSDRSMN
jgi:hypothetical protein